MSFFLSFGFKRWAVRKRHFVFDALECHLRRLNGGTFARKRSTMMMAWSPGWLASRVTALPLLFWCGSSYPRLAWWLIESSLALAWLALDVHSMRGAALSPSTASSSKPFILKLFQSQHLNCKLHFFFSEFTLSCFCVGGSVCKIWRQLWFGLGWLQIYNQDCNCNQFENRHKPSILVDRRFHSLIVRLTTWKGWGKWMNMGVDSLLPDPVGLVFLLVFFWILQALFCEPFASTK